MAPPAGTHIARRPLITAWRRPRPLEIPEGFLRVCVLARRRQRPPGRRTYPRAAPLALLAAACALPAPAAADTTDLAAGWRIQSSALVADSGAAVSSPGYPASGWIALSRPQTLMAGLVENGDYPDVFRADNLARVPRSRFDPNWWYRTTVTLHPRAGRHTFLIVNGVASRANLWVNGVEVADQSQLQGPYSRLEYDVTPLVRDGANAIALDVYRNDPALDAPDDRTGLQLAPQIADDGPVSVRDAHVVQDTAADLGASTLTVKAALRNNTATAQTALLSATIDRGGVRIARARTVTLAAGATQAVALDPARVERPDVWWPRGLGGQPLYHLEVAATAGGEASDRAAEDFGIRTVSYDPPRFSINGVALAVRGGAWSPDEFLRYSPEQAADQLAYVDDLGLNAIRFDGDLPPDDMLAQMDRAGVLALPGWQCCDAWRNAANQARTVAARLRDHPSVAGFVQRPEPVLQDAFAAADWRLPIVAPGAAFDAAPPADRTVPTQDSLDRFLTPVDPAGDAALRARYGPWSDAATFQRAAQAAGYEATRALFEARLATTGLVYRMLQPSRPSLRPHLFGYDLDQPGAYFGAKKAGEPVHVLYAGGSVAVANLTNAAQAGLRAKAEAIDLGGAVRAATARDVPTLAAQEVRTVLVPKIPAAISATYFLRLTLTHGPDTVSRNVYWLGDLSGLRTLAAAGLEASESSRRDGDDELTAVTLRNPGPGGTPAFLVRADVRRGDERVLPIRWSDNHVTLWPGETLTLTARYRRADLGGASPAVSLYGWNVSRRTIAAPEAAAPRRTGSPRPVGRPGLGRARIRVNRRREARVKLRCGDSARLRCAGRVRIVRGGRVLARRSFGVHADHWTRVRLRLTRSAYRRLVARRRERVTITLVTRGKDGVRRSARARVTLFVRHSGAKRRP